MVEAMKIMVSFFKRSHACTATLSASNPAAGHHQPTPLLETPGHSQASLGESLVGSLLLSPGSWCAQGSVSARQESISQSCVSSGSSVVGLMVNSSKGLMPYPGLLHPEPLPLQQATVDPYLHTSVQFSHSVTSNSLRPHGLHQVRPPCQSPTHGVYSNSCPLSQ